MSKQHCQLLGELNAFGGAVATGFIDAHVHPMFTVAPTDTPRGDYHYFGFKKPQ